jgi:glycosyltransferase involved in cell wall biosynthesis
MSNSELMNFQPAVSCICLTYGRPELLEEAIHSFLVQDYAGPKELIVLNDYAGQSLTFDHADVQVINVNKRFRTVGEKMNAAVALASHDLLFVWDDDDVYLPHRLSFSVSKFDRQKGFFKPDKAWYWENGKLSGPAKNIFHSGSCWSRDLFDAVAGYAAEGTGYDLIFEHRLEEQFPGSVAAYDIRPEEVYYLYRWSGTGSYHMSAFGDYAPGENVGHDQVEAFVEQRVNRGEIRQGTIPLRPHWKSDYQRLVNEAIQSMAKRETTNTEGAGMENSGKIATGSTGTFVGGGALGVRNTLPSACSVTSNGTGTPEPNCAPVKLAYLIVAHHQPEHSSRLIRALNQEDSYFFIHIDAKADLHSFQTVVPQFDNVTFVPNRVLVEWGGFSVVQAVLNLIQAAVTSGHPFSYYTLLSGSDYPIKHKQAIGNRFRNSKCQYMRIDRRLTTDPEDTHARFVKNLPQGRYFGDMTPYQGSMYWSLTDDCIRFTLDFINSNPGYLDIHHHMPIPDEVFFHTLVKHSSFAEVITHDFSVGCYPDHTHHANHFIDWAGLRKRDYLVLDERDFDDLLASDALFARKFDRLKSSKLLDLLDTYVHYRDFQEEA